MPYTRHLLQALCIAVLPLIGRAQAPEPELPDRSPFYIAPVIEGLSICLSAKRSEAVRQAVSSSSYCGQYGFNAQAMLSHILNSFEAGGPAGKVRIGYTATIPLLSLYEKKKGRWLINTTKVDDYLALIAKVDRPVVVYLASNHFDTQGPLSNELAKDPRNLLRLANGKPPSTSYFGYAVTPFTLLTDENLPVNHYRFEALRYVAQRVASLPQGVQQRIVAVTLAGELHQLFNDFENGMGAFEKAMVTDYSPQSIADFKRWLAQKYGTIDAFNKINGFAFADFGSVPVPSKDIRTEKLTSIAEHYDGFAGGRLPVSGWLWAPAGPVDKLELYIDGRYMADIPRGLNRLDVYRAVAEIKTPNVGFRYELAYDKLPLGRHVGQVVAHVESRRHLVAQFDFNTIARDQGKMSALQPEGLKSVEKLDTLKGARAWLDLPRPQQDVYFNPLARDWDAFRASQVYAMVNKFYEIAHGAGIATAKLYSHQIVPQVNSTWNEQLFAVDTTFGSDTPWHNGMNMYGGAADSDWVRNFIATRKIQDYGVPEFNPQQWKQPGVHLEAMLAQYRSGARFISPYFISVTSKRPMTKQNAVTSMEIRPDNRAEGSAAFYRAIRELAGR